MKVLAFLFLVGCASAFVPSHLYDNVLDKAVDELVTDLVGDASFYRVYRSDDGDTQSEIEKKVREAFDKLLEKVKDALENGKTVQKNVLDKLKELREKMRDMKIDMGEKAKELFQKIKDKAKDFLQNLLDKLGMKDEKEKRAFVDFALDSEFDGFMRRADDNTTAIVEQKLREAFDRVLERVKDEIARGKILKEELVGQLKELRERMKDLRIDMSQRAKDILEAIKEKAKDYLKNLLIKLGLKDKETRALAYEIDELVQRADDDETKTELEQKIRDAFDRILENIKDAIDHGKTVKQSILDKLQELREKMKDKKIDIGDKAKELYKKIKEKAKDFIKDLLEKLGLKDKEEKRALAEIHSDFENTVDEILRRADEDSKTEIGKKLREALDVLLERVKDEIARGRIIKDEVVQQLKEIRERMRDLKIDLSDRAKDILNIIKEKAKDYIRNLLEEFGWKEEKKTRAIEFEINDLVRRAEEKELVERLRDAFNRVLEKIKDAVEKGKNIEEKLVEKLKELAQKLKEKKIDVGDRARELYEKIREKAKEFLKNLLDNLGKDSKSVAKRDLNIRNIFERLKDALLKKLDKDALKEKIHQLFGKGTELAEQLIELLKTKGEAGKQKLLDLVDRILGEKENEKRSLQDVYDKVRDYFKNLKIELKEKYVKFGQWVKDTVKKGIDETKSKLENIKGIAKEFVENAKEMKKDIAVEALEFLKPYREDLGELWEHVKQSVKEILKRED